MSSFESKRHYRRRNAKVALLAGAVFGLLATPALADDPQCLLGTWKSTLREAAANSAGEVVIIPIEVLLSSLETDPKNPDAEVAPKKDETALQQKIIFGAPRRCRLSLAFAGFHDEPSKPHYHLTMVDANGGLCNKIENTQLRLACVPGDANKLRAWYKFQKADKTTESVELALTRAPPPAKASERK